MKPKEVAIVLGSPRKNGNSTILAGQVARGVRESDGAVEEIWLHGLNLQFCLGCTHAVRKPPPLA